jgi:hypothetical protein
MRINHLRVENYKSYGDSGRLDLADGFNVLVGQNSAGKSALVEVLRLDFGSHPHRTLATVPHPGIHVDQTSSLELEVVFSGKEVLDHILVPGQSFMVALPVVGESFFPDGSQGNDVQDQLFLKKVFEQPTLTFQYRRAGGSWVSNMPGSGLYAPHQDSSGTLCLVCAVDSNRTYRITGRVYGGNHLGDHMLSALTNRVYAFRPQRTSQGISTIGTSLQLSPDSSNLAEVLSNLQSNAARFRRFNELVSRVLPQVRWVSTRNINNNTVGIVVWPIDHETEREDLAMSLSECGTGIGQVIALLYAVISSDASKVIVIDEPQSFLHPGAARKLVEVLSEFPRHQYILTTHSPSIVSAANPSTLTLVENLEGETKFSPVNPKRAEDTRRFLAGVGARLADVFGADRILWVEGPTEELSFPKVIAKLLGRPLAGTAILGVKNTGDLEGRHARIVLEIYNRLCEGQGLLPPAVGFVFDREGRSERDRADLTRQSNGRLHFLGRRLYENYLLDADAVASVIGSLPDFADAHITPAIVTAWMDEHRNEGKYWKGATVVDEGWNREIHAAKLLADLFNDLSGGRYEYQKTDHSVAITEWLLENKPGELSEVADLLAAILDQSP